MKKTIKIVLVSMLIILLAMNTSYATTEMVEQANKSLVKLFCNNIKIVKNSSNETIILKAQKVQVEGDSIKILDTENQQESNIKYSIENTICKFESSIPITLKNDLTEQELLKQLSPIMNQLGNFDICYLTVADALGIDLSLAYTYYAQNYNNESIDTQNKIYSIKTNLQELITNATSVNTVTITLEVNCLELMMLNLNDIDQTNTYTVTIEEVNLPVNPEGGKEPQPEPQPQPQPQPNPKEDETIINKEIPKAGLNKIFGITISVITIFSIIMYRKNKKYKGIF